MKTPELERAVLRLRGGQHHWKEIREAVESMTDRQREALYRIIENAVEDAKRQASSDVRRNPWKYLGS